MSSPNVYRADALVKIQGNGSGTSPLMAQGAISGAGMAPVQTQPQLDVGMLKSRAVVGPVVERLHLDIDVRPLRAPLVGGMVSHFAEPGRLRGPWPAFLGYAWGGEQMQVERLNVSQRLLNVPLTLEVLPNDTFRVRADDATLLEGRVGQPAEAAGISLLVSRIDARPGTRFLMTRRDLSQTVDTVTQQLSIESEGSDAGTLRIAWQSTNPVVTAALVNGIASSYTRGQESQRRTEAAASLAFLSGELPRVKAELERAEAALTRYRARNGSIAPSQDAQSYLNSSMEYQRQIASLRLERTKLLQRFTPQADEVKTVDSQIQQLIRERQDMDSRMQNLSLTERESVALTRDVKVAEDMYMTLRNKVEQLSVSQVDQSGQIRVIDIALVPSMPVGGGSWPMVAGGGVLGLCLAMGCVTLRQRWRPTVASANEAELTLGMVMLGDIAFSREQVELDRLVQAKARSGAATGYAAPITVRLEGPQVRHSLAPMDLHLEGVAEHLMRLGLHDNFLLARNAPHSMAVEGLRSVRAAMHFSLHSAPDNVVAVTSPAPGAGKTFTSVNLAVLFAEAGQRVLLIDADLRRGMVASWFDQPADAGLAEVLAGRTALPDAVRPTVVGGLSILPAGMPPENPSELLMHPALADCLRVCANRFDLVLVDTSPVLPVADATLVANLAGSTVLVLRADDTQPAQVEETLKRLARADARLLGGILNGVTPKRSNRAEFNSVNPYLGVPLPIAAVPQIEQASVVEEKKS